MMQVMREGAFSGVIKFFFIILLALATGGLVLTDVGGFFRGGVSGSDVARVGSTSIGVMEFDRFVQRNLRQMGMSPQEAYQLGLINQMMTMQIRSAVIKEAARANGVEMSRQLVAKEVNDIIEPLSGPGQDKQQVLNQVLLSQGISEAEFARQIASEQESNVINVAMSRALPISSTQVSRDLYLFQNEKRDLEIMTFAHQDYVMEQDPGDEDLQSAYETFKENYAIPETRDITIIRLDEEAVKASIDVSEERLREIYDTNKNDFLITEQRVLEQAIVDEQETAQKIFKAVEAGKTLKEASAEVTEDESAYKGEQTFEKIATLSEVRSAAFKKDQEMGKVVAPVKTALGWHVIIPVKRIPPSLKPFDGVKNQIKEDELAIKSVDQLYELSGMLDDMLAGGTSIEDIQKDLPVRTIDIQGLERSGLDDNGDDALKDFAEDRALILENAFEIFEGEGAPVFEGAEGAQMSVRVNSVREKSYTAFEEVRADVQTLWIDENKASQNRKQAADLLSDHETLSEMSKAAVKPIKKLSGINRLDDLPEPLLPMTRELIFSAAEGEVMLLDIKDGVAIARITSVTLPDIQEDTDFKEISDQLQSSENQEALSLYLDHQRARYGATINQGLLHRMYGQDPQTQGAF